MPRMQVNATRMELMRLRKRLETALRGHSLLKDKLDGLMQEFLQMIERYKAARRTFNEEFPGVLRLFVLAGLTGSREAVLAALTQSRSEMELSAQSRNVAGVNLPQFSLRVQPGGGYSLLDTPMDFDEAVAALQENFERLVQLAELEHGIWLFIAEIKRTRRRVNALEYVMIPDLREALKYIRAKLEENERANTVRLMKIKEMRLTQQRREEAAERARASL